MTKDPDRRWEGAFTVRSYEVDQRGMLSVVALCNWLQEAAGRHAVNLGWGLEHLASRRLTWVLARLHVRYTYRPSWGHAVHLVTWPAGVQRAYAVRDFSATDDTGRTIALATSGWLLVDLERRRPVRPTAEIESIASGDPPRALDDPFTRLPESAGGDVHADIAVPWSAIDVNGHANNVRVVAWLLDSVPADVVAQRSVSELEVEFRAEAWLGDRLISSTASHGGEPSALIHRLTRATDGQELARALSKWDPGESGGSRL